MGVARGKIAQKAEANRQTLSKQAKPFEAELLGKPRDAHFLYDQLRLLTEGTREKAPTSRVLGDTSTLIPSRRD